MDSPPPFPSSVPPQIPAPKSSAGKWVLIGCGGCLGLIVLGVLFSVGIYVVAMRVIQKTDVYEDAFKRVQNSAEVQAELGTPIETGWAFSGSVNYKNGSGNAEFTVPVTGPKGEGSMNVKADKSSGAEWKYSTLEVEFPDGHKVDLRGTP
ncbi:MAG: cytochrome c oxidase assembly factor 1 family protein [Prosthecobacter sp.]|uniref:cytochrome c oxidase assembly factor Coa1 family protein n=1 Tax=Prosthecobacter sp. TaxID=1965333 RepID=UPI0025EB9192|nr:cytochrome c oxidase assembly factor Coa1 family protein [Prosthecobacter sp.]MCF7787975.1 cytochrome c oxidase assembly factor 1 family protein [Prosthecobacter sp.]